MNTSQSGLNQYDSEVGSNSNTATGIKIAPAVVQFGIEQVEKEIFNGEIADIIEVTYAYAIKGSQYINKTLFFDCNHIGFDSAAYDRGEYNLPELVGKTEEFLRTKLATIIAWIQWCHSERVHMNPQGKILLSSLTVARDSVQIALLALPFEAEKAGVPHTLVSEEVRERVEHIEKLEDSIFGGNVGNSFSETLRCLTALRAIHDTAVEKETLNTDELKKFSYYLSKISKATEVPVIPKSEEAKKLHEDTTLSSIQISREQYTAIFTAVFSLYGINMPVIIEERSSIYDSEDALRIPSSGEYDLLPLDRILTLIQHEIECHYVNLSNSRQAIGNMRGANNLQKEEGIATLSEYLLDGYTFDELNSVTGSLTSILAGEILEGDEFDEFVQLMRFALGAKRGTDHMSILLRRKRNYPLNYRGVQHKDTSYTRGIFQAIQYIQEGKDIRDLFLGKVGFDDLASVRDIFEEKQLQPIYPYLVGEIIAYSIHHPTIRKNDFLEHVYRKYPFLKEYGTRDLTFSQKRKVVKILENIHSGERVERKKNIRK